MIKTLIVDCDGVLTDGKQYIDPHGDKMFKAFHSRDIKALRWLVSQGIHVVVITADDWHGVRCWCVRVGLDYLVLRDKMSGRDGLAAIQPLYSCETAVIGDDAWDVRLLKWARVPFCPSDAEECVRRIENMHVIDAKGGQGVIARMLEEYPGVFLCE